MKPLLAVLALLLAGCPSRPYFIVAPQTGIPVACWVTERDTAGFVCADQYGQSWYCRWTMEDKEMDGRCSPLGLATKNGGRR